MTIVHLSSSLGGGGAQQMVYHLANQSHGTLPTKVISVSKVNTLEGKFMAKGIECHFLNIDSFKSSSLVKGIKKFNTIAKDYDAPVLHCHQFHGLLIGLAYKVFYRWKAPIVFTLHSSKAELWSRRVILFLTKFLRKSDVIFSDNVRLWYLKNSDVIANGLDFSTFSPNYDRRLDKKDKFRFLFLGRLSAEKNPEEMITSAQYLIDQGFKDFVIDIVGEGLRRESFEASVISRGLTDHIKIHGFQENVGTYIDQAHCLVLPSHFEGLPVVLVEAAASLLPIVSTPVGSIPDFLNESNGYPSDLESFGKTMGHVMTHYDEALEKSKKLKVDVESIFDIKDVYAKHLGLYKSVL